MYSSMFYPSHIQKYADAEWEKIRNTEQGKKASARLKSNAQATQRMWEQETSETKAEVAVERDRRYQKAIDKHDREKGKGMSPEQMQG